MKKITSYLGYGKQCFGIEHTSENNEDLIYTTMLTKAKNKIEVSSCFKAKNIESVGRNVTKKQPACLVINNDQVITKSIKRTSLPELQLVNTAFPNLDIKLFYYEIILQNNNTLVSVCRQSYVEQLIDAYHQNGIYIISFSLGSIVVSKILSYLNLEVLYTSNTKILIDNLEVTQIEKHQEKVKTKYDLNGLKIQNHYVLSTSMALTSILNNYCPLTNAMNREKELVKSFKRLRFYDQFLKSGMIFILCVLLINFICFSYYYNKVEALSQVTQSNQSTTAKMVQLKKEVEALQKTTEVFLKGRASKSAFYVNEIVFTLPKGVLLSEIDYQPLQNRIKTGKVIVVDKGSIIVSGTADNNHSYSFWVTKLESLKWVDTVEVLAYANIKETTFKIKILCTQGHRK